MSTTDVGEARSPVEDEESALLRAVLEDPDNDTPREAYAEWCAGRDDARHNFIKIQLRLAGLCEEDDFWTIYPLRRIEEALLEEHGRDWASPISEWVAEYQFHRGFVELVTMPAGKFLDRAPELFALAPIRHLNLTDLSAVAPEELFASEYMQQIRSLSMERCHLRDEHIVELSRNLRQLRWLSVGENEIGPEGVYALVDAPEMELEYVRLYGNPCDPGEQYAYDGNRIVQTWLPKEGRQLEKERGYIRWLHLHGNGSVWNTVPNRFQVGRAEAAEMSGGRGLTTDA